MTTTCSYDGETPPADFAVRAVTCIATSGGAISTSSNRDRQGTRPTQRCAGAPNGRQQTASTTTATTGIRLRSAAATTTGDHEVVKFGDC